MACPRDAGTVEPHTLCRATLYLLNTSIGVLLPTFIACFYRWPEVDGRPHGSQAARQAVAQPRLARLARRSAQLASAADRWLIALAGGYGVRRRCLFIWWYALAVTWWICRMAAGIV